MTLHLAITMGDPAGVGPEIIAKACAGLSDRLASGEVQIVVIGNVPSLLAARDRLAPGLAIPEVSVDDAEWPALCCLQVGTASDTIAIGKVAAEAGDFAFRAIEAGVRLAESGRVRALVTAPLNKEALNLAGHHYSGHTDMLADLTGASGSVMMLAHGNMRVSHVTTHTSLASVPAKLTPERLRYVIDQTNAALGALDLPRRRIAVAALNPHAGENGLFGREDLDVSAPVIAACNADGLEVVGPEPGDTVFVKLRAGQFDAVIAMYHDQGHIPVKLLGFHVDPATGKWDALSGVNVTLGLPILRTSVDHGTAFDIAGQGIANELSLVEAIDFAAKLSAAQEGVAA